MVNSKLASCTSRAIIGILLTGITAYMWQSEKKYIAILTSVFTLVWLYILRILSIRDDFTSKDVIIITGCDSGLGYSLALHCQALGAKVIASCHNEHSLGAEKLKEQQITIFHLDIASGNSINQFNEKVKHFLEHGNLNLRAVINNAGVMIFGEFEWQTEKQRNHQINVNLLGTMNVTWKLLPLVRAHAARIIFISSHCAAEPLPGVPIYGATKAALLAFATSLRVEMKKCGVKVVSFIPGGFVTESNLLSKQKQHFADMRAAMSNEAREFYGDYYDRYEQFLSQISNKVEPQKLSNELIFKIFEGCILDRYPSTVYKCEPWRYTLYHTLFTLSPICIRDQLVEKFMCLPNFKK